MKSCDAVQPTCFYPVSLGEKYAFLWGVPSSHQQTFTLFQQFFLMSPSHAELCKNCTPSNDFPLLSCNRFQSLHKSCFWRKYIQKHTSVPVLSKLKTKSFCVLATPLHKGVAEFQMVTIGCHKMYILIFQNPQMSFSTKKSSFFVLSRESQQVLLFHSISFCFATIWKKNSLRKRIFFSFVWKSGGERERCCRELNVWTLGAWTFTVKWRLPSLLPKRRIYGRGKN